MLASGSVSDTFLNWPDCLPFFSASSSAVGAFARSTSSAWRCTRLDQRGIDVNDLARGDFGGNAGLHRAFEDASEPLRAPTLPDPGQRGMIRQRLVQAVPTNQRMARLTCASRIRRRS